MKENGECEKLIGNMCSVYDTRPGVCRIERQSGGKMSEGIKKRIELCNEWIRQDGMNDTFLIKTA